MSLMLSSAVNVLNSTPISLIISSNTYDDLQPRAVIGSLAISRIDMSCAQAHWVGSKPIRRVVQLKLHRYQAAIPRGRDSQGPPFPASVVIFIILMLLHTKEVLINKKLG